MLGELNGTHQCLTQSKHTINDCHYYYVYRFQFSKREIREAFQVFTTSKWQSWAWNIQPMALLLVLLPHTLLEDDWHQDWDKGSSEKSPQNLTPAQTQSATPPLPPWTRHYTLRWLQPLGQFQTNEKKPGDARVMEHRGTEPRGADTAKSPISKQRPPRLTQAHPTLCTTGRPSPLRPADPAAPELVTQFLFCQAEL